MGYTFMVPEKILSGTGVIDELGEHIQGKGTKALIVTDAFMVKFGNAAKVENALKKADIPYVVYDGANSEPTDKIVDAGLKVYREEGCDFLVALGGGSPMDTAKAIMFMSTQPEGKKINEFMHVNIDMPVPYLVAIPTTAGTGSELSRGAILSSPEDGVKTGIRGEHIAPAVAIVDSSFTYHVPPRTTAETGFDVFAHAMESFVSRRSNDVSRMLSERAIALVGKHLPHLMEQPDDHASRDAMSYASLLMGSNLAHVGTALPHRMQYPVGAHTDTSHGAGLLALYPAWLRHEYAAGETSAARIDRTMTLLSGHACEGWAACEEAFSDFLAALDVRKGLRALGIQGEAAALAAEVTGAIDRDPAAEEPDILRKIYEASME